MILTGRALIGKAKVSHTLTTKLQNIAPISLGGESREFWDWVERHLLNPLQHHWSNLIVQWLFDPFHTWELWASTRLAIWYRWEWGLGKRCPGLSVWHPVGSRKQLIWWGQSWCRTLLATWSTGISTLLSPRQEPIARYNSIWECSHLQLYWQVFRMLSKTTLQRAFFLQLNSSRIRISCHEKA